MFFLAWMGNSRPMRMAETFTEICSGLAKPDALNFMSCVLLCLSSMLPGMDFVHLFGYLFGFTVVISLWFALFWVSWRWSKRLKFRNLFFWWLGLYLPGLLLEGIYRANAGDVYNGLFVFPSNLFLVAMIFRGCRFLWEKISKKSSDS